MNLTPKISILSAALPYLKRSGLFSSYLILLISLISCNSQSEKLSLALKQTGKNRAELIKVLDYYSANKKDSLKYKAAEFLIENMPGHFSYQGNEILSYYDDITVILDDTLPAKEKKDTIEKIAANYPGLRQKTVQDIQIITAQFLIENIDRSFELWEKPWAKHLTFEQLCEYLLPYKYTDLQILDAWKDTLATKFCNSLNDMPKNDEFESSTYYIAQLINTEIRNTVKVSSLYDLGHYRGYDFLSAKTIYKIPFGLCPDYVALGVLALRSHGVPVVAEYTPLWGRSDSGHSWYTILNDNGSFYSALYDISSDFGNTLFGTLKIPKIYRQTYAQNPATKNYFQKAKHIHHSIKLFQTDVTDKYIATSDINISLIEKICLIATRILLHSMEFRGGPLIMGRQKTTKLHFIRWVGIYYI